MLSLAAILLGLSLAASGLARLWRVMSALAVVPEEIGLAIARNDRPSLGGLARALRDEGGHREADLVDALLHRDERARIASVNEVLSDWADALAWDRDWPAQATRIGALGAMCLAFAAAATGNLSAHAIVEPLVWGAGGVFVALLAGKEAERFTASARRGVDLFVDRMGAAALRFPEPAPPASAGVDQEPAGV